MNMSNYQLLYEGSGPKSPGPPLPGPPGQHLRLLGRHPVRDVQMRGVRPEPELIRDKLHLEQEYIMES